LELSKKIKKLNYFFFKGFGDFVPGQQENDSGADYKIIGGFFYIMIGMALIAMSFDLMQDEIILKFTWLGTKMGIIDPPPVNSSNDDYDEFGNIEESKSNNYIHGNIDTPLSTRVSSQKTEMMSKTRQAYLP
jgi:hypothetical protein